MTFNYLIGKSNFLLLLFSVSVTYENLPHAKMLKNPLNFSMLKNENTWKIYTVVNSAGYSQCYRFIDGSRAVAVSTVVYLSQIIKRHSIQGGFGRLWGTRCGMATLQYRSKSIGISLTLTLVQVLTWVLKTVWIWGQSYKDFYTLGQIYKRVLKHLNNAMDKLLFVIMLGHCYLT